MNRPLATSRFRMTTLHQVQRRSGRSAEDGVWFGFDGVTFAMRAILSDR